MTRIQLLKSFFLSRFADNFLSHSFRLRNWNIKQIKFETGTKILKKIKRIKLKKKQTINNYRKKENRKNLGQ